MSPGRQVKGVGWTPNGGSLVASVDGQLLKVTAEGVSPLLPLHREMLQFPVFFADGRLAAVHNKPTYDIISVDPDGGEWQCLLCNTPRVGRGSAGRDGAVLYQLGTGEDSRVMLGEPGRGQRALTENGESASCPVLSPDGTKVAYLAKDEGSTELRVRPVDGGDPVTLARDLESSEFVAWSPDSASIAYAGGAPLQVWVVSAAGGAPRAVSGPGGDYPVWSPDGELIAFAIWTEDSDPDQGTWVVPSLGGEPTKVGDLPTRVVWEPETGALLQLRRSFDNEALELWAADPRDGRWTRRSRLDIGARPPIQMEYLPLTVDLETGRLVMNRLTVTGRLMVFDGIELDRW
jgi:WD40 repeat protein